MKNFKLSIVVTLVCTLLACQVNSKEGKSLKLDPIFSKTFDEPIAIVDISDDGNHFLAGGWINKIRFWTAKNPNLPVEVSFEGELVALQFTSKNNKIFFADGTGVVRLFGSRLNDVLNEYRFPMPASYACLSDDSKLIAYGENILLYEKNKLVPLTTSHAAQSSLQISSQNYVLTSGYHDASVIVRDAGGNILAAWKLTDSVQTAAISSSGDFVIASTEKGDCRLWQVADQKRILRFNSSEPALAIHIDSTGKYFVLVMSNSISAYQVEPFKKIFSKKIKGEIRTSILARNNWLAIGLLNGHVQLWDIFKGNLLAVVGKNKGRITSIDINPSANLLMTGSYDGYLSVFRIQNEHEVQ